MVFRRIGFLEEFFRELEEMDRMLDQMFDNLRSGAFEGLEEPFWGARPLLSAMPTAGEREPFSEIIIDDKNNELILTIEMPGVEKKDITIDATEKDIEVRADTEARKYHKYCPLDVEIDAASARATYNNGVLEIKAKLKKEIKSGMSIKVE